MEKYVVFGAETTAADKRNRAIEVLRTSPADAAISSGLPQGKRAQTAEGVGPPFQTFSQPS